MQGTVLPQDFTPEAFQQLCNENGDLRDQLTKSQQQIVSLQQQLDWLTGFLLLQNRHTSHPCA